MAWMVQAERMTEPLARHVAIRTMLLPKDTNGHGTIFGGVILSQIDLAGAIEAQRHTRHRVVTVAVREVEFHQPAYVGDILTLYTSVERQGRTSITIRVSVEAQRAHDSEQVVHITDAVVVYVAVDAKGNKVPLRGGAAP
jgi:acyl-CoA thioesterase YciA